MAEPTKVVNWVSVSVTNDKTTDVTNKSKFSEYFVSLN